jgi:hypothetical protein
MGYIRVDTVDNGQQIIDGKRVLNVNLDTNGDYIEFILDFFNSTPNQPIQIRLNAVTAGSLNSDTLIQYNDAVVSAQSIFVVDLTPVTGQELQSLEYNPNP